MRARCRIRMQGTQSVRVWPGRRAYVMQALSVTRSKWLHCICFDTHAYIIVALRDARDTNLYIFTYKYGIHL